MGDFNTAVDYVIANEGGLEEPDSSDPGGISNHGISLRLLKALTDPKKYGFSADSITADTIRDLTLDQAKAIYQGEFWDHAPFDKILNQDNCNFIFDMAVNMGIAPSIKCAQRACWAVAKKRGFIPDDGILGDITIGWINEFDIHLLAAMRSERAGEYRMIAEKQPQDKIYLDDWLTRSYGDPK